MAEEEQQTKYSELDPYWFLSPEQSESEKEKARQDALRNAIALENTQPTQLPTTPPAFPMRTEISAPPVGPPLDLPVSSGRMYMGPALGAGGEEAFHAMPDRTSINLIAPPTPEVSAGAAGRVAEMLKPVITGAPYDPAMEQFRVQQQIKNAVAGGMPMNDAIGLYGMDYFGSGRRQMTPYQSEQTRLAQERLNIQRQRLAQPDAAKTFHAGNRLWSVQGGKASPLTPDSIGQSKTRYKFKDDEFGPEMTGPADSPEVVARLAKMKKASEDEVAKTGKPGPITRAWNAIFGGGKTASTPALAAPETSARTKTDKVSLAKQLRAQHPDWTKEQILAAVNQ